MMWRMAHSLDVLLDQLNSAFPDRSTASDGSIGDLAHSQRTSDHNPNRFNVVQARDFTHDPATLDGNKLLAALLAAKDPRIKYIIFNRKIYNSKNNLEPKAYSGINAHKHHLHLSVSDLPHKYDDGSVWVLDFTSATPSPIIPVPDIPNQFPELARGARGQAVRELQTKLWDHSFFKQSDIDGEFGGLTQVALQRFQLAKGLTADGICGHRTWQALNK